ncbi:protein of unknown function [uncultured Sphingopyxis sp.]|uniref:Uncharacterized protein n=1 Tax=uncultured Sphingopyxis sp. TaxID=310581 RepID=A0A1Y5PUE2_9SPHN|nr:protein of unknown function [uncultured Sphingopyxis sp.]
MLYNPCCFGTDNAFFVDSALLFPLSDRQTRLTELPRSQSFGLLGYSEGEWGVSVAGARTRNGKEREAYVCPNGPCQALRLHLRRGDHR